MIDWLLAILVRVGFMVAAIVIGVLLLLPWMLLLYVGRDNL